MVRNYFIIAWRNLLKNKGYSLINIGGLSIGITAYLLIIQYVNFESNYDQQQPQIDDLYRVTLTQNLGSDGMVTWASNHPAVGFAMKQDFPEVESFTRVVDRTIMFGSFVLSYKNERGDQVKSNINDDLLFLADSSILNLFNIPFVSGNPETALTDPASIIISEDVAKRFFGNQDPMNKNLLVNNNMPLKVTGVFQNLPENTHLKFNMLVSFSTLNVENLNQTWIWPGFYNYVRLKPGTDPERVEDKFPEFTKKYLGEIMKEHKFEARFDLQPVKDIHLKSDHSHELELNANEKSLSFLRIIAVFVILIALMNFINLSTAKSTERAMEVGLKKVVGIKQSALIGQFLFESMIINFIAVIIAIAFVSMLMNPFNQLVGLQILSLDIWLQFEIWIQLFLLIFLGGILAGAYPAFVLSSFKPIQVLKGRFHQSGKGALTRKALVVAQFSISVALITGTYIIYNQFSFMQNQDLGFDSEHNLIVHSPMVVDSTIVNKMETFKNELLNNPKINNISSTNDVPGEKISFYNLTRQAHVKKEQAVVCNQLKIDHNFLDTYQIKLLAGRNFRYEDKSSYDFGDPDTPKKPGTVLLNEAASKILGFDSPEAALQKKIIFGLGSIDHTAEVIGVLDNYHQQSLQNDVSPMIYLYQNNISTYLTINMNTSNVQQSLNDIENKFEAFFPMDPFNYFFLDDHFNLQYQSDRRFGNIFLLFAGLAIFIAILGLFGLGSYLAIKKTKELCIRKVLGANTLQVMILIPKSLLMLVGLSGIIAIPITYFMASEWLSDYAFRIILNPWMFALPLSLVVLVAALSVIPESLKVSLFNPANYLRNE